MKDTTPIIVARVYDASIHKVWQALTDCEQMKQWYFKLLEFKAEVGFEFDFFGGPPDGIQYKHLCKITEVISERKISYTWIYDGYVGESLVSFELFEAAEKTKLVVTHTGVETFEASNKDFDKINFVEGWNHILTTSLTSFLEKN
jgi:uncharacterized protein YndB with AHSA1/START domain